MKLMSLLLAVAAAVTGPAAAYDKPLFDAHLHYSQAAVDRYPLNEVLEKIARAGVSHVLVSSTPNDGTRLMFEKARHGVKVIPFIRPYRTRADMAAWWKNPGTMELIREEMARGFYKGIGEFHLSGRDALSPEVAALVKLAIQHDFWLHAHSDDEAIAGLHAHDARLRAIWAHCGFSTAVSVVEDFLKQYPQVMCELSYRSGITENGQLTAEWRRLFTTYPQRFLLGSDTWVNERWHAYENIMNGYRPWLKQLPGPVADAIASGNAIRLFAK